MKQSILAARRQLATEAIAAHVKRLGGGSLDLVSGMKGNAEHRNLMMLERIEAALADLAPSGGYSLEEILAVDGLTRTSRAALEAAFGDT